MNGKRRISQIIIERTKTDENDLVRRFGKRHWRRYHIKSGKFFIGLQPPAGFDPASWAGIIGTIIAARGGLIYSAVCLTAIIRWAVSILNQNNLGGTLLFPDPQLLLSIVTTSPLDLWAFKPAYASALATVLQEIADGCSALHCYKGIDIARDVVDQELSCVIEIPLLNPPWLRLLLIDLLIAQLLYGLICRNQKTDQTIVVIYLDEGDPDLNAIASDARYADMYSILAQLLRMGREYGILVVVAVGVLGHISKFVSSSFQNIAIFSVSGDQIVEGARILQLPRGGEQMLSALKPGECLFRENQGAWPHTMWGKVDYVQPDRSVRDVDYDSHPFVPAKNDLSEIPEMRQELDQLIASHRHNKLDQGRKAKSGKLSPNALALLTAAIIYLWLPVARLWERTGKNPSPAAQQAAREELENRKLADFEEVRISRRNVLLIWPTDAGCALLGQSAPGHRGRGGIGHSHICEWLRQVGQKRGHESQKEMIVPGSHHPVDVAWKINGQWHVFEVVVDCKDNLVNSLETSLTASPVVAAAIVVAPRKDALEDLKQMVAAAPTLVTFANRIFFEPVETFLKELSL